MMRALLFLCALRISAAYAMWDFYDPAARATSVVAPPPVYDLRDSKRLFPVIPQGKCNSCFAMAATTSMEYWAGTRLPVQNIMDCSRSGRNAPCKSGGAAKQMLAWAEKNKIYLVDKKYQEIDMICDRNEEDLFFQVKNFDGRPFVDAERLRYLVWTYGPVVAPIHIAPGAQPAENGFLNSCDVSHSVQHSVSHSVAVIGYKATDDTFIVQDSASGTRYWMAHGSCGLGNNVLYITAAHLAAS